PRSRVPPMPFMRGAHSDFHYSQPTPFVPELQAAAPVMWHILRHTRFRQPAAQRLFVTQPV
ncbi:hypothetical protein V6C06_25105, partial (plasmid) [Vreelandella titanicae]